MSHRVSPDCWVPPTQTWVFHPLGSANKQKCLPHVHSACRRGQGHPKIPSSSGRHTQGSLVKNQPGKPLPALWKETKPNPKLNQHSQTNKNPMQEFPGKWRRSGSEGRPGYGQEIDKAWQKGKRVLNVTPGDVTPGNGTAGMAPSFCRK